MMKKALFLLVFSAICIVSCGDGSDSIEPGNKNTPADKTTPQSRQNSRIRITTPNRMNLRKNRMPVKIRMQTQILKNRSRTTMDLRPKNSASMPAKHLPTAFRQALTP